MGGGAPCSAVNHPPNPTVTAPMTSSAVPAWNARALVDSGASIVVVTTDALGGVAPSLGVGVAFGGGTAPLSKGAGPAAGEGGNGAGCGVGPGARAAPRSSGGCDAAVTGEGRSTATVPELTAVGASPMCAR